ncbi:hypothetical protein ACP275_02G073200 [Erythranthe tilingii]
MGRRHFSLRKRFGNLHRGRRSRLMLSCFSGKDKLLSHDDGCYRDSRVKCERWSVREFAGRLRPVERESQDVRMATITTQAISWTRKKKKISLLMSIKFVFLSMY